MMTWAAIWGVLKVILIIAGIVAVIAWISYFAVQGHLDRKAQELARGDEYDRQMASDLREISRQIDRGNMYR